MPVPKLVSIASTPVGALVSGFALVLFSSPAAATLHGYCAGTNQCMDNGTNSPTMTNPPSNFGFTTSPGGHMGGPVTGVNLQIDVLVPNNEDTSPSALSFALTGTLPGTAKLFSSTPWNSGMLDTYLGISGGANPTNPIGNYLNAAKALDPGATGFFVYQANLGTATLNGPSKPNVSPLEHISPAVPLASFIVGFFNEGTATAPKYQATANSGAIFVTKSASGVPEPATLLLLVTGLAGLGVTRRRRRS